MVNSREQVREIGCIQIDVGNAKRLGIKYQDSEQESHYPVIIHSAIPGGIERYIYMLIDDMSKFPIYFQPVQLRIIPVSDKFVDYASNLASKYSQIRIDIDDRKEGVSWKIKQAHHEMIPEYMVIGEREMQEGELPASFIDKVKKIEKSCEGLPQLSHSIPRMISQRVV